MLRKILEEKVFSFEEFLMNLLLLLNEIFKGTRNSPSELMKLVIIRIV